MHFHIISAVPELLNGPFHHSILARAHDRQLLQVTIYDLRQYGIGKHKQIDDYQFGGGAGMVLKPEPLYDCISQIKSDHKIESVIYLTPDGEKYNQSMANQMSLGGDLILICGHYKGIDQRIRDNMVDREISIGDYVISGGELAAAIIVDSVGRLIPGVLNDETSALFDSFQDDLLAPPVYTRPATFHNWKVPDILLSGHSQKIEEWRYEHAILATKKKRPDLLKDE